MTKAPQKAGCERKGLLTWVGGACLLLALLVAILIVERNYEVRKTLAAQGHEQSRLRMRVTVEHLEDHMRSIWLGLWFVSVDPDIATMAPGPYDHVRAIHEATFALHGLTEVYVAERAFDGKRHPLLSFYFKEEGEGLVAAHHPLERELEEYAVHVEQIRLFSENPSLRFLVSKPVQLCVGRPGVVCSVPVRSGGYLAGIVAGMVKSEEFSELLGMSSAGHEVILASDEVGVFTSSDVRQETLAWFQDRFDQHGVQGFFEQTEPSFPAGGGQAFWTEVSIPGEEKWYIAYVHDEDVHLQMSAVQSSWAAWASAVTVMLMGLLGMFLCRVIPALQTARARADMQARELAESEARTRTIVDTAADGIITIDERGRIEFFNTAAERIFGYTADEVVGNKVNLLMPSPHRERHDEYLARHVRGGPAKVIGVGWDVQGRRKDGSVFPLEAALSEVRLPDRVAYTGVVRDISQHKKDEKALRESEERYRTLVENIDLGVTLIDANYNILMTNQAQGDLFKKPRCEFVDKKCFVEFEKRDAVCPHCPGTRAMATGKPSEAETEGVRDDGSRFTARIRAFPIPGPNGEATGFIEVVEDISERRRSEEQARERQAELAHVARLGTIGEMAAGLAHELNQPLTAIVNYIQASLESVRGGKTNSGEWLEDMEQAAGQAVRAGEIIERLRRFTGKTKPQRTTVNMNVLVREVLELTQPEIRQCGVTIRLELDESLASSEVDAIQIEQVLVNLIKNGIEAMADDETDLRRLTVRTSNSDNGLIECDVSDTGPGLCQDATDHVFDAFFSTKVDGMGVGLSISRRIIEAHGGRLWATPDADRGVTFRFTLPVGRRRAAV